LPRYLKSFLETDKKVNTYDKFLNEQTKTPDKEWLKTQDKAFISENYIDGNIKQRSSIYRTIRERAIISLAVEAK
jgi:hypothetical protein